MEKSSQISKNPASQVVTFTFFRFATLGARWWAFGQMGRRPFRPDGAGLSFVKLLGSGGGNGFSMRPNWGVYGLIAVFESEDLATIFFEKNVIFKHFLQKSSQYQTIYLKTTMSHGNWESQSPFAVNEEFDVTLPLAVLTRATIKPRHYLNFWRYVPSVSRSMEGKKGLIFSVGVGELPIVQQATFSLWQTGRDMMNYAYQSPHHAEVVKKTRELGWYSEELFARFRPFRSTGNGFFDF